MDGSSSFAQHGSGPTASTSPTATAHRAYSRTYRRRAATDKTHGAASARLFASLRALLPVPCQLTHRNLTARRASCGRAPRCGGLPTTRRWLPPCAAAPLPRSRDVPRTTGLDCTIGRATENLRTTHHARDVAALFTGGQDATTPTPGLPEGFHTFARPPPPPLPHHTPPTPPPPPHTSPPHPLPPPLYLPHLPGVHCLDRSASLSQVGRFLSYL